MTEEIATSETSRHTNEKPMIGVFSKTDQLLLRGAPNGGWIVAAHNGKSAFQEEIIGAYGSAAEMICALQSALVDQS
ncbi:hypothetical protein DL1_00050 [Thioclava dalianensis]|uniref:Uncharacterized protein n=1 Tax=Thioclava dalianensis TaxID=1185766 RepID=A0A074TNN8_9RHOB|nr:hypothetical protein [Thioclava dalianensis]KEP71750.1 hypothetical protein DL1_00050 [Thioclava dalianensis]SFN63302.1 hypothetical protein SAMN05216224_10877 [Thioclava dalianensis]